MKKEEYKRGSEIIKLIIIAVIFVGVLAIVYFLTIYTEKCSDNACFDTRLVNCKKATWINDAEEAAWLYSIKGKESGNCEVEVKLLLIKKGKAEIEKAEGKSMTCYLPLNTMSSPGENLEYCTGKLKEELQDIIIKRMHSYILDNLGEIKEELTRPIQNAS